MVLKAEQPLALCRRRVSGRQSLLDHNRGYIYWKSRPVFWGWLFVVFVGELAAF